MHNIKYIFNFNFIKSECIPFVLLVIFLAIMFLLLFIFVKIELKKMEVGRLNEKENN